MEYYKIILKPSNKSSLFKLFDLLDIEAVRYNLEYDDVSISVDTNYFVGNEKLINRFLQSDIEYESVRFCLEHNRIMITSIPNAKDTLMCRELIRKEGDITLLNSNIFKVLKFNEIKIPKYFKGMFGSEYVIILERVNDYVEFFDCLDLEENSLLLLKGLSIGCFSSNPMLEYYLSEISPIKVSL